MIQSAGFILTRHVNGELRFLLLRCYKNWDFPKGKKESNENLIDTAFRETREETGITKDNILVAGKRGYTTEPYTKSKKTATYFLGVSKTDKVVFEKNPITGVIEHHEYRWVNFEEGKKLCNERIGKALDWANEKIKKNKFAALLSQAIDLTQDMEVDLNEVLPEMD